MLQITCMATEINCELTSGPTRVDIVHGTTSITSVIIYLHFLLTTVYKWTFMREKEHHKWVSTFTRKQNTVVMKSITILHPWHSNSGEINFLYSTASRLTLDVNQPPIRLVAWTLFVGVKWQEMKLTIHLQLVPRSRMVALYLHFFPHVFMV
jgi:hypothetical protein